MHRQRGVYMLIVDDSKIDTDVISVTLFQDYKLRNNFTIKHTIAEAKEYIVSNPVDVLFLDLNMPGENPLELLDYVKANENLKNIFVVVVTASSDPRDWDRVQDRKADCYVVKPLNIQKMQQAVADVPKLGWMVTIHDDKVMAA